MSSNKAFANKFVLPIIALVVTLAPALLHAQSNWSSYKLVPKTVYEKKPMKITRWVDETVTEKKQVTSYKPIWQTEQRERRKITYKPVKETVEREEKIILRKPVVETMYRDKTVKETTYEMVTKYRDEEFTVREPVMETEMRTETYTVRKPVTKKMIEVTKTTSYKPVVESETAMVSTQVPVIQLGSTPNPNARPRIQWLQRGYYTDPATGQTVYRKRGLHWVQPNSATASVGVVPALVPQEVGKVSFVPETTEERKPIEITRYVDEQKTRRVPVEVKKMVERTETRRVPYEVKIPKTTVTTEKIPYKRTTYKEEVITKKVPYTRSTMKKVETIEPYEVEVPRWVTSTKEVEVPKTVKRKVEYEVMQDIPKVVMMKVPVDVCGNELAITAPPSSTSVTVESPKSVDSPPESEFSIGVGSTLNRRVESSSSNFESGANSTPSLRSSSDSFDNGLGKSVIETGAPVAAPSGSPRRSGYRGLLVERNPKLLEETSAKSSIAFPDTTPSVESPRTSLEQLEKPRSQTSEFTETSGEEIVSSSQVTNRVPKASQWRTNDPFGDREPEPAQRRFIDNPFGEEWVAEDLEAGVTETLDKPLIETSVQEVEQSISLPGATKPDASFQLGPSGDESAADRLFKSPIELNGGS